MSELIWVGNYLIPRGTVIAVVALAAVVVSLVIAAIVQLAKGRV